MLIPQRKECSFHIFLNINCIAKHAYRDRDFRLVGVHVWNYIAADLKIDTSFSTFKNALKRLFNLKFFGLI